MHLAGDVSKIEKFGARTISPSYGTIRRSDAISPLRRSRSRLWRTRKVARASASATLLWIRRSTFFSFAGSLTVLHMGLAVRDQAQALFLSLKATFYLSDFRELMRHLLQLPSGSDSSLLVIVFPSRLVRTTLTTLPSPPNPIILFLCLNGNFH